MSTSGKLSLSDFNKRTELLSEFLYWLFDSIVIHLIRTNFYVTETAVHKNRVFYFRHDVWKEISSPSIAKLKESMLDEISKVVLSEAQTNDRTKQTRFFPTNLDDRWDIPLYGSCQKRRGSDVLRICDGEPIDWLGSYFSS